MVFTWRESDAPDADLVTAATAADVYKRWTTRSQALICDSPQVQNTTAGRFLTSPGQGRHLLAKSQR
eukprot:3333949-Rhodomonas_salina.1